MVAVRDDSYGLLSPYSGATARRMSSGRTVCGVRETPGASLVTERIEAFRRPGSEDEGRSLPASCGRAGTDRQQFRYQSRVPRNRYIAWIDTASIIRMTEKAPASPADRPMPTISSAKPTPRKLAPNRKNKIVFGIDSICSPSVVFFAIDTKRRYISEVDILLHRTPNRTITFFRYGSFPYSNERTFLANDV